MQSIKITLKSMIIYLVMCLSISNYSIGQGTVPLSKDEMDQIILKHIEKTGKVFNWSDASDHLLWSALILQDSLVSIGYKPRFEEKSLFALNDIKTNSDEYLLVRNKLIDKIINQESPKNGSKLSRDEHFPIGERQQLPYIEAKVYDIALVKELRSMPEVEWVEPMTYVLDMHISKSDTGCSDGSDILNPLDYTIINPPGSSLRSWHHDDHNVPCAWNESTGDNVTIAILDTGVSSQNPNFNADWATGSSTGRSIIKIGVFDPNGGLNFDGWEDQCGHGSQMTGLAAGPLNSNMVPAGIAYQSDVYSYRVTEDVLLNTSAEKDGVIRALGQIQLNADIKIISMSLGDVFYNGAVALAIQNAVKGPDGIAGNIDDKTMFAAAGTTTDGLGGVTNFLAGVIFPANIAETVAVTGVKEESCAPSCPPSEVYQRCDSCHEGNEVDFVVYMERERNGDNYNTLTTTLGNNAGAYRGYVGGSSAATASMAGIAALTLANNPGLNPVELKDKLIQAASNFPTKDDDHGWGAVDVCQAVDTHIFNPICDDQYNNQVQLRITGITFPNYSDGGGNNEWVVTINGTDYFFSVPSNGTNLNDDFTQYAEAGVCGVPPIIINLPNFACAVNSTTITVNIHESEAGTDNCVCGPNEWWNPFDDEFCGGSNAYIVDFNESNLTHTESEGGNTVDFTISYELSCIPDIWSAVLADNSPVCIGEDLVFTASPSGNGEAYIFFNDIDNDDLYSLGIDPVYAGSANTATISGLMNNDKICVELTRSDGCIDISCSTINLTDYSDSTMSRLTGTQSTDFDFETNGVIDSDQIIDNNALVDYDSAMEINLWPGFETKLGVTFEAFIDGCDDGGGGILLAIPEGENELKLSPPKISIELIIADEK